MCRSGQEGGRRCPNSGRSTQNRRQRRCRANRALRAAIAAGDPEAITQARQRLDAVNADTHDHETTISDKEPAVADDPTPTPAPVTGELSGKPLLENTWGDIGNNSPVHYHDDGPVGTAVKYMGPDARMDVDGEPLANVVGRIATDVVRRKTKAQQAVDDLKQLRDRLPEGSRAKMCLSQAVRQMDGPDTPVPQVPDDTPEPLRDLVRKLHAVPMVRREPEREMQPLLDICGRLAAGDKRTAGLLDDEVRRLRNKRHESLGDSGKFEIDDAINDTVKTLREQERQRAQMRQGATFTVHNTNIAQPGANVGSQQDVNHDDVNVTRHRQAPEGDVTAKLQRAQERVARAQERARRGGSATTGSSPTVHAGPRDQETGARSVNVTGGDGIPGIQIGRHYGDVWINGKRVD